MEQAEEVDGRKESSVSEGLRIDVEAESNLQTQLIANSLRDEFAPEDTEPEPRTVMFPFRDPGADASIGDQISAGIGNMGRLGLNAPQSSFRFAKDLVDLIRFSAVGPHGGMGTVEKLGRAIAGSGEIAVNELSELSEKYLGMSLPEEFISPDGTVNQQMAQGFGEAMWERFSNPGKTATEDPMGFLADLVPAAKGAGVQRILGRSAVNSMSPTSYLPGLATGATGVVGGAGEAILRNIADFTTGAPARAYEAIGSAASGAATKVRETVPKWMDRVLPEGMRGTGGPIPDALRDARFTEEIANDVLAGLDQVKAQATDRYNDGLANLQWKVSEGPRGSVESFIDLDEVRYQLDYILDKDFGLVVERSKSPSVLRDREQGYLGGTLIDITVTDRSKIGSESRTQLNRIKKVVREIDAFRDDSPAGIDILKQRLQTLYDETPASSARAKAAIGRLRSEVRQRLGDNVVGYNEVMEDFAKFKDEADTFAEVFSTGAKNRETFMNKLTDMLKEPVNFEIRRRVMGSLVEATKQPIVEQIAATVLSTWRPTGLVGRGFAAAAVTAGIGIWAPEQVAKTIVILPLMSPRAMGEFFMAIGQGKKAAATAREMAEAIQRRIPEHMATEGLTYGGVLQQLDRERSRISPVLERISGRDAEQTAAPTMQE